MMEMILTQQVTQLSEGIAQPEIWHDTMDHSLPGNNSIALVDSFKISGKNGCILPVALTAVMTGAMDGVMRIASLEEQL